MKRVLLIERDASTRRALEFALALRGYVTTVATSTAQFRELAQRRAFALLVAGQSPDSTETPADLCRALRAMPELAHIPLLALEVAENTPAIEAATQAGANGALVRPVDAAQLEALLTTLEPLAVERAQTVPAPDARAEPASAPSPAATVSERYRVLVESSLGLTFIVEPDGDIVWANPATQSTLERDPAALAGTNLLLLCHPEDAGTLALLLDTAGTGHKAEAIEVRFLRHDGATVDLELHVADMQQHPAVGGLVLTGHDVSARVERERMLRGQVLLDGLTGLPNRLLFIDQAERSLARAERRNEPVVLVFIDLDDVQEVSERHGRSAVDDLLRAVALRLSGSLRANDTTSRFGDDEFAVLLDDIVSERDAAVVAERLLAELTRPFEISADDGISSIVVTSSIGVAVSRPKEAAVRVAGETRLDDLLRRADAALSRAKASGKARWVNADDLGNLTYPLAFPSTE